MELTTRHYAQLIGIALNDRPGSIPLTTLQIARTREVGKYKRANYLAELEDAGLITITPSSSGKTGTIRLTEQGKAAILALPSDLHIHGLFPLPMDIANAKRKISGS